MKVKASITLSETMLRAIDQLIGKRGNRSAFIEQAVREHVLRRQREARDARDIKIINAHAHEDQDLYDDLEYLREISDKALRKFERDNRGETGRARAKGKKR